MNIFNDPALRLKQSGKLTPKKSVEIANSRLAVGFETIDRFMFKPEKCYEYAGGLGVKYARSQTAWCLCEKEKGRYDFSILDGMVDSLLSHGIEPWFNLTFGNPLYMPDHPNPTAVGCVPTLFGDECSAAWQRYVRALAAHFQGRVQYWEIWNEPNHPAFWYPSTPSGKNYAEFVAQTVPHIKAESPDAKIIGCSAGIAMEFIRDSILAGLGEQIDFFSHHPYGSIPEHTYFTAIASLKRFFAKHAPHVRLMQGECGYPSQTYGHHDRNLSPYNATEQTQAKFVLRRVLLDYMADMQFIAYFHIADLMENTYRQASGEARPPVMLGLLNGKSYTPKKSYYAMRNIASLMDGECGSPETMFVNAWMEDYNQRAQGAIPALSIVTASFLRRGYPLYSWYYPEDLQREWEGNVTLSIGVLPDEGDNKLEQPVLIDCMSGNVYEPMETLVQYGSRLTLKGLPLTDYPVFLTDKRAIDWTHSG